MTDDTQTDLPEPRNLRKLRVLVTVLMWVMIVGMVSVVGLLALRLSQTPQQAAPVLPALPDRIALPPGTEPLAVTAGPGWYAVVTVQGSILVFDAVSGALVQDIAVDLPGG
ncbi:hypothetical protein DKT77_05235 [Meridianimarinicoccus roseus]|uniref:Uncharacterized protein n=1 Tax=Meridianimarinicoccus roseus TaxID=2072018 RepID=A0A2V2LDX1_9RHOB|nr:DUF6476 family protein [Meridianimarinicoccus roseus]PWR03738.1 hypothetical protein DKT77_05235 [Meridianimarinicoccus roseus]